VVEIGAGLDTRYERLDNGRAHWLELDLPDSMALRRTFFEDTDRRTMICGNAMHSDLHQAVAARPAAYCFISEAVAIYLEEDAVQAVVRALGSAFRAPPSSPARRWSRVKAATTR